MDTTLIDSFIQEYVDFQKQFAKKGQERLKQIVNLFFDANPGVNVITWTQYAPYFNDGDPCEFYVNELTFSNALEEDDIAALGWGEYNGETEGVWATGSWRVEETLKEKGAVNVNPEWIEKFNDFIQSSAMEDILKTVLGEDVKVIITRNGIVSEDYSGSHD